MNTLHNPPNLGIRGSFIDNQIEDLLSAKQLADMLKCSLSYIKKLRKLKVIQPEIKLGRFVRYNLNAVRNSLQKRSLL